MNPDLWFYYTTQGHLNSFYVKNVKFNMINCPTGYVYIDTNQFDDKGNPIKRLFNIEKPFLIGETKVTQELFENVMGFNYSKTKDPKAPVTNVTCYDCLEFCNKMSDNFKQKKRYDLHIKEMDNENPLSISEATVTIRLDSTGFRLPTEREWQFAAMAGTNNKHAGTNDDEMLPKVAWVEWGNNKEQNHIVAQKLPNEWGLYDMAGNVSEWCEDEYGSTQEKHGYSGECNMNSFHWINTRGRIFFDFVEKKTGKQRAVYENNYEIYKTYKTYLNFIDDNNVLMPSISNISASSSLGGRDDSLGFRIAKLIDVPN
jgi:formylglycine-generating enzyme required for sulfatase activity